VFLTATFLINHLPTPVLHHMSPIEKLFTTKPAYSFLRTFGCACWPNLRLYNTHKLAFQSKQCIFLGYSTHHKGYKCLDISTTRVYISRDVVFDKTISLFPRFILMPTPVFAQKSRSFLHPKSTNPSMQECALPEFPGAATATDRSVIAPRDSYFLAAVGTPITDPLCLRP
jgi:hypothetical protein